jgi:hypothetical protein
MQDVHGKLNPELPWQISFQQEEEEEQYLHQQTRL